MNTRKLLLLIIFTVFLEGVFETSNCQSTKITVDTRQSIENLSELFNSTDYIILETNSKCLLRYPVNLVIDQDRMFIQDVELHCFDVKGRYLNSYGSIGKGPGEFVGFQDSWIDTKKKRVEILSGSLLNIYNYDGSFVERHKLYSGTCFGKTWDGQYLIYNNLMPIINKGNPTKSLLLLTDIKKDEKTDLTDHFKSFGEFPGVVNPNSICDYKDKLIFTPNRSLNVYETTVSNLRLKYELDFKIKSLPRKFLNDPSLFALNDHSQFKGDYVYEINNFREADNYASFWFYSNKIFYYTIVMKEDFQAITIPLKTVRNDISFHSFGHIIYLDNDKVICYLQSNIFIDEIGRVLENLSGSQLNDFKSNNKKIWQVYNELEPDDNPILVIYNFKQ